MEPKPEEMTVLFIKSDEVVPEVLSELKTMSCKALRLRLLSFDYSPFSASLKTLFLSLDSKDYSAVAFNSSNSVIALKNIENKENEGLLASKLANFDVFVVGEKTSRILEAELGLKTTLLGKNLEDLVTKINEFYENKPKNKILYLIGSLTDLSQYNIQWEYDPLTVYRTREIEYTEFEAQMLEIGDFDVLAYFSASNVRFFLGFAEKFEHKTGKTMNLNEKTHVFFGEKAAKEFEACFSWEIKPKEENLVVCSMSNIREIPEIIRKVKLLRKKR